MEKTLISVLILLFSFTWFASIAEQVEKPALPHETEVISTEYSILDLDEFDLSVAKGQNAKLTPIYDEKQYGKNAKFTWSSSDTKIATVSNGTVQAKSVGDALITCTATFKDGTTATQTCTISVYQPVSSFTAKTNKLSVVAGKISDSITTVIKPDDSSYPFIKWTSSDESVATVDELGRVTGIAGGKATIIGELNEPGAKKQKSIKVQITVTQSVSSIAFSRSYITVGKGKNERIKVTVKPSTATNTKVIWSSSDDKIATVVNGTITGKKAGKCIITAAAADGTGASAQCTVTVIQLATSIRVSTPRGVVHVGMRARASATVSPADATHKILAWESDDPTTATVDQFGNVEGIKVGTCKVYAKTTDGSNKKAVINLTVEPKNPISLESISFGVYNYNLLGLTVRNRCKARAFKDFSFDMTMYNYMGTVVNSGSYSLGKTVTVGANNQKTITRTVYGVGQAYKVTITITDVTFTDGTVYKIPADAQETWTFTR